MTVSNIERQAILNTMGRTASGTQLMNLLDTLAVYSYGKQAPVVSYTNCDTPLATETYGG